MKRIISLYIAGQKADLADDALVLLNIQREDLYNPTIVRNSYTQSVTLPGTPANNRIFDHYFRADHAAGSGFNPLVRVPFSIYAASGEILVAGYCKLNASRRTGGIVEYDVTLYGGLGDFIYGLAYDADGNKKSLASLDYLGGGDTELDFVIDKTAVADAWARLGGDSSKPAMWDVINFAPAYNGIPDGEFDADKALAVPADVGIAVPAGYNTSSGGYVLIELPERVDEWAAHDLRSYLQRPVLSVKALLEAIANPGNNGGWSVDLTDIASSSYLKTWLTRPLLPSLGTFKQSTGALSVTFDNTAVGQRVAKFDVTGNLPGEKTTLRMEFAPVLSIPGQTAPHVYMHAASDGEPNYSFGVATFIQPIAYDSSNNIVAYGNVLTLCPNTDIAADTLAAYVHFTPQGGAALISTQADGDYDLVSAGIYKGGKPVTLEVSGLNVASVLIRQTAYIVGWNDYTNVLTYFSGDGTSAWAGGFTDPSTSTSWEDADGAASADGSGTATSTPNSSIRSGARITKRMLLSTDGTPADYLLALCKTFGLYILVDAAAKSVRIVTRDTLYENVTTDLTERVDVSQGVTIEPLAFDAKWYDFKHEGVGGAFEKEYKEISGRDYGAQRVNTGYDFDATAKDVLKGVVLKGTAAVKASGPYWCFARYEKQYTEADATEAGLLRDNGTINTSHPEYSVSPFIPIPKGVNSIVWSGVYPGAYGYNGICIYDSDKVFIAGIATATYDESGNTGAADLSLYPGAAYIRFSPIGTTPPVPPVSIILSYSVPALFLAAGANFTAWDADGEGENTPIAVPLNDIVVTQYAGGYDINERAQFEAKDGKPVDGADVLLFAENFFGNTEFASFEDFNLTDDVPDMDTINGKPCWLLGGASGTLGIPHFSRYIMRTVFPDPLLPGETSVVRALDFGIPSELDIPNITYDRGTIYERCWRDFIHDRLDVNAKVMRCRVRLDGLQVGPELLRRFWWYGGSLWVLNKISNYSLTTFDPAECEFIQVRDKNAYLNGQNF